MTTAGGVDGLDNVPSQFFGKGLHFGNAVLIVPASRGRLNANHDVVDD